MAGEKKTATCLIVFYVVSMIISGTVNTLTTKMQFQTYSTNKDGDYVPFTKPWFATFNMLAAMACVGIVDKIVRTISPPQTLTPDAAYAPLTEESEDASYRRKVLMVSVPAAFDLVATAFCCMGMLYLPASIWQMLKGGSIIFCAILSVLCLKRELFKFHWLGLVLCVSGLIVVGMSNVLGSEDSNSNGTSEILLGMGLVMLGQVVQAGQLVAEEYLMKDVDLPGMQIIGWEGIWGTLLMLIVVYPLLWFVPGHDHGHFEDAVDTFTMVGNSPHLFGLVVVYLLSCGSFNASGIAVTGALSATHRMMMDASRTSVIWGFGLAVHYYDPESPSGEAWTPYSYLQLIGFLILVTGQAIYGQVLKLPGFYYPREVPAAMPTPGSLRVCSPLPQEREQ